MKLIHITGWAREKVKTETSYSQWLSSIKDGDLVLMQRFNPPGDTIYDFSFARWGFQSYEVHAEHLIPHHGNTTHFFNRQTGKCRYPSGEDWGNVFAARVVPISSDINPPQDQEWFSHAPIYEPLWLQGAHHVFLAENGFNNHRVFSCFRYYYQRAWQGEIYTCFSDDDNFNPDKWIKDQQISGLKYLYSKSNPK